MLASETQNADYLQGDDARWNHKEIERLRSYTVYVHIYMHVYMREMGDRARLCEPEASRHKFLFRKRLRA